MKPLLLIIILIAFVGCLPEGGVNSKKSLSNEDVSSPSGSDDTESGTQQLENRAFCALFGANDYLIFSYQVSGDANSPSPSVSIQDTLTFKCDLEGVSQNTANAASNLASYATFVSFGETDATRISNIKTQLINAAKIAPLEGPAHLTCVEKLLDAMDDNILEGPPDSCLSLAQARI